ncbi:NYN domain-containing protein [uncultured Xylophilus sp.]|uniref:NYN domain-containing protein n=1 Tax=uncultured Xylophilus sp. TaxID=296832 RepID=UPI0025FD59F9|nr:NYN domain-containing protein [uncultured Xylophilus sp.]
MSNGSAAREARIALLIDADNSPAQKIEVILTELSTFGVTNVRRAYGNWKKAELRGWEDKLHEHAIRPMQQFDYSKGKNASDMAMVIDAMELLYTDHPEAFGIVSSDADFTPLVMHLRAKGASVYGFGARKTPEPFVNACSRFLFLDQLVDGEAAGAVSLPAVPAVPAATRSAIAAESVADVATVPRPAVPLRVPPEQLRSDTRLVNMLRSAVVASADESGWARVGAVGTHIANKASFDARNFGYATLTKLLSATGLFDLQSEGSPQVAVRDRRHQKASKG